jgi:hypothetical protein
MPQPSVNYRLISEVKIRRERFGGILCAQRIVTDDEFTCDMYIAYDAIIAGSWLGIGYIHPCVSLSIVNNVPGVTPWYSLPSACITRARSEGVIFQAST